VEGKEIANGAKKRIQGREKEEKGKAISKKKKMEN